MFCQAQQRWLTKSIAAWDFLQENWAKRAMRLFSLSASIHSGDALR